MRKTQLILFFFLQLIVFPNSVYLHGMGGDTCCVLAYCVKQLNYIPITYRLYSMTLLTWPHSFVKYSASKPADGVHDKLGNKEWSLGSPGCS